MDYKTTINLPSTAFPMKADLARREPLTIEAWEQGRVWKRMNEARAGAPVFSFHDGPPYANGHSHYGHILNKVLKDIIVKHRSMAGFLCRYIPGWDCHGLPIELAVAREKGAAGDPAALREACRAYAEKFIAIQMAEFKRLGTFAEYDRPYKTIEPAYEGTVLRALRAFVEQGALYRSDMPIFWCIHCTTALALAEIEYEDHESDSVYVHFPVTAPAERARLLGLCGVADAGQKLSVMIWTTTPWTLPANLAIALHPSHAYGLLEAQARDGSTWLSLVAAGMGEKVLAGAGVRGRMAGTTAPGRAFEGLRPRHPFEDRDSPVVLADYVTLDTGTGAVHTAPGHGAEDYQTGVRYKIPPYAPVDREGRFTADAGRFAGLQVFAANPVIAAHLDGAGLLLNRPGEKLVHSYPHCWRCKQPVIFLATPQWFISMDRTGIRRTAVDEIGKVRWIPEWGRDDIKGKVEGRPDWCISRQRTWGVPLPFLYCEECGEPVVRADVVARAADIVAAEGSGAWLARDAKDFTPPGTACPKCGSARLRKETDIFDVWFESGVSWYAVSVQEKDQGFSGKDPAQGCVDLYLEGKDQHRGWFHTALLTGVGVRGAAPYRQVLTHGFVVDEEGRRYSKSKIEKLKATGKAAGSSYIPPDEIIGRYGAEILRLWVAYEDFRNDIAFSEKILTRLVESYRKIRNTFRFMLGNLGDFDPEKDAVEPGRLELLDRWALARLRAWVRRVREAYENYEFHRIYHDTAYLMNVDLSAFYLDILKDRLYCEERAGEKRRAAQTAIWHVADQACRLLAPVLSFTADEVWAHLPRRAGAPDSVFLAGLPSPDDLPALPGEQEALAEMEQLKEARDAALRALEAARAAKAIGQSLEAEVTLAAPPAAAGLLARHAALLPDLLIVSSVRLEEGAALAARVGRAPGEKCARCWKYATDLAAGICPRCAGVVARQEGKS